MSTLIAVASFGAAVAVLGGAAGYALGEMRGIGIGRARAAQEEAEQRGGASPR